MAGRATCTCGRSGGGEPINLTANWDLDPGSPTWSPDGRFMYFSAGLGGATHLFRVTVPDGRVEQITNGPRRLSGFSFDKALTRMAYTANVHHAPPDVYVANIDGTNERRLTDVHKPIVEEIAFSKPIDPKRVGHTGHSYGGCMTNWLITQYPDRFAAAIAGAGISNWISDYGTADIYRTKETEFFGPPWDAAARERMIKQSPLTYAARVKTPTLFVHGEVDQRVPYEEAEQMYFALKRRGVPAKMIRYEGQAHGISGHWNNVHRMINGLKWWNQYLGAARAGTQLCLPLDVPPSPLL